jgi:hypothetical protein
MDEPRQKSTEQEPMGIVISRGSREEAVPRLTAYMWAQVDETVPPPRDGAKAA